MIILRHRVSATAPIRHFNFNNRIHLQPGRGPSHCRPIYAPSHCDTTMSLVAMVSIHPRELVHHDRPPVRQSQIPCDHDTSHLKPPPPPGIFNVPLCFHETRKVTVVQPAVGPPSLQDHATWRSAPPSFGSRPPWSYRQTSLSWFPRAAR